MVNNANQAQNLRTPQSKNKVAVWFLYVTLEFVSEGLALLIVHVISELLDSGFYIRFSGYSQLPTLRHCFKPMILCH